MAAMMSESPRHESRVAVRNSLRSQSGKPALVQYFFRVEISRRAHPSRKDSAASGRIMTPACRPIVPCAPPLIKQHRTVIAIVPPRHITCNGRPTPRAAFATPSHSEDCVCTQPRVFRCRQIVSAFDELCSLASTR